MTIYRDEIVRKAFASADVSDFAEIGDWLDRLDPRLINISKYFTMWYYSDFVDLSYELSLLSDDDADALKSASDLMARICFNDRTLYEATNLELDTLAEIADISYGDYTNILRTFLDAEYGISVIRESPLFPRSSQVSDKNERPFHDFKSITLAPNPTKDCIKIVSLLNDFNDVTLKIYNSLGELVMFNIKVQNNSEICLKNYASGIYFVTLFEKDTNLSKTIKLLLD